MSYEIKKNGRKYDVVDGEGNVLASLSKKNAAQTWIQRKIAKDREEFKNMVENAAVESVEEVKAGGELVPLDRFTGIPNPPEEKPKPEEKKKSGKKAVPEPKTKFTRIDAFLQAFTELNEKGFTKEQIIQRADDLYVKQGGRSNIPEGKWYFGYTRQYIAGFQKIGLVNLKNLSFNVKAE